MLQVKGRMEYDKSLQIGVGKQVPLTAFIIRKYLYRI